MDVEHEVRKLAPDQMCRATQEATVRRQVPDERNEHAASNSFNRALATARLSNRAWHVVRRPETTQTQTQMRVGWPPPHRIWDLTCPAQAIRGAPQGDVRSRKYWVRDGTIVLRAGQMLFKIGRQLFSTKCTHLRQAIQDCPLPGAVPAGTDVVDGCPVFGLNLRTIGIGGLDFEWFLIGLYCPDRYVPRELKTLPDSVLISLMRTARLLGEHTDVYPWACSELGRRYRQDVPPPPRPLQQGEDAPHKTALRVIALAREHTIPGLMKCAAYRIVADPRFWANMDAVLQRTGQIVVDVLNEAEVVKLGMAREWLQREWRTLVSTPPCPVEDGNERHAPANDTACRSRMQGRRKAEWCAQTAGREREQEWYWAWSKLVDNGADDPFAALRWLNTQSAVRLVLRERWCERCLDERWTVWNAARVRWWAQMDGGLRLAC
ncbi:hypothetical protein K466DRAFT_586520, partial [Polyporus arcularius HHB13444]